MASDELTVEVVYSPAPRQLDCVAVTLPAGSRVSDALQKSGLLARHPALADETPSLGIWGKRCRPDDALRDRDRVEVYRPLRVDPKEARRQRHLAKTRAR